jgi:hypothetical protein
LEVSAASSVLLNATCLYCIKLGIRVLKIEDINEGLLVIDISNWPVYAIPTFKRQSDLAYSELGRALNDSLCEITENFIIVSVNKDYSIQKYLRE